MTPGDPSSPGVLASPGVGGRSNFSRHETKGARRDCHPCNGRSRANFAPSFAADGKRIIFSSNYCNPHSRNFDLYLVNLDGTGLDRVTTDSEFDGFPMFSPDGRELVWTSGRHPPKAGGIDIYVAEWVP